MWICTRIFEELEKSLWTEETASLSSQKQGCILQFTVYKFLYGHILQAVKHIASSYHAKLGELKPIYDAISFSGASQIPAYI